MCQRKSDTPGRCARCTADRRLHELLGDQDGHIHPQYRALYQALSAEAGRPAAVTAWLDKTAAPAILQSLKDPSQLTHQVLDELSPRQGAEHLRAVLVAIGALPPRDERLTRLERWTAQIIAGRPSRPSRDQQQLLHRYLDKNEQAGESIFGVERAVVQQPARLFPAGLGIDAA